MEKKDVDVDITTTIIFVGLRNVVERYFVKKHC